VDQRLTEEEVAAERAGRAQFRHLIANRLPPADSSQSQELRQLFLHVHNCRESEVARELESEDGDAADGDTDESDSDVEEVKVPPTPPDVMDLTGP
jgi:hypothetical protein